MHIGADSLDVVTLTLTLTLTLDLLNAKINMLRLRHIVEDYYLAKFQAIPIKCFRFIVLTYTHTRIYSHKHILTKSSQYPRAPPY